MNPQEPLRFNQQADGWYIHLDDAIAVAQQMQLLAGMTLVGFKCRLYQMRTNHDAVVEEETAVGLADLDKFLRGRGT